MGSREQQQWSSISAIFICFFFVFFFPSLSLSEEIMQPHLSTGRSLLQAPKGCPVNFENLNYTIITSVCKGPKYPPKVCCEAFKNFACPYGPYLNDATNNCATTMFSYINLNGKYPPGLFANECTDSKRGLECTAEQSKLVTAPTSATSATSPSHLSSLFVLSVAALLLMLLLL